MIVYPDDLVTGLRELCAGAYVCEVSGFNWSTGTAELSAVYCGGRLRYAFGKFAA